MTQEQKAQAWLQCKGFNTEITPFGISISVWNDALDEVIFIYLDTDEITYRAKLWEELITQNQ